MCFIVLIVILTVISQNDSNSPFLPSIKFQIPTSLVKQSFNTHRWSRHVSPVTLSSQTVKLTSQPCHTFQGGSHTIHSASHTVESALWLFPVSQSHYPVSHSHYPVSPVTLSSQSVTLSSQPVTFSSQPVTLSRLSVTLFSQPCYTFQPTSHTINSASHTIKSTLSHFPVSQSHYSVGQSKTNAPFPSIHTCQHVTLSAKTDNTYQQSIRCGFKLVQRYQYMALRWQLNDRRHIEILEAVKGQLRNI
jgi:hypothetical protein